MLSSPQVFIEMIFLKNCLCISPLTSFLNCLLQTHLPYCAQHALQRTASKDISQWNYVDLVVSLAYSFPNSAIANEHPLAGLKQEISLRVQETGSRKSRCWQGQFLLEPQRKGPILCFSPSFQQSVACGHITLISVFIFISLSSLCQVREVLCSPQGLSWHYGEILFQVSVHISKASMTEFLLYINMERPRSQIDRP